MKKQLLIMLLLAMILIPVASACVPYPPVDPEPDPTPEPSPKFTTIIVNPHLMYKWNGKMWVYNTPTILVVDGRTWVIYS